jgi:hypothetical protein|uniref:Uncharacterized protein n=1 Tax=Picea glauca TaxID=3330 RepID=A0A101M0L9_PICGL|nr:hypothetical protein ABT39_MTgene4130 [Picea glauca]QHR86008.1 hypothetical protein Q903MT_gene6 [Picea sitchensis]
MLAVVFVRCIRKVWYGMVLYLGYIMLTIWSFFLVVSLRYPIGLSPSFALVQLGVPYLASSSEQAA